jgi:carbamoyltransferase
MYILGISAFYHDSAACILKDGEIIAAAQEERFTRIKQDFSFPENAIFYCLKESNVLLHEVAYVVFYEKPFVKFERLLETYLSYVPFGILSFWKAMPVWIKDKLFQKKKINKLLHKIDPLWECTNEKLLFSEHHMSHAASAFYPSPFDQAFIITADGVGEWSTTSVAIGSGNEIQQLREIRFPHSLGLLYSAFTYYLGFKVNSDEYKVMGLAPYGEPKYVDIICKNLIDIKEDGSFRLNMNYFDYCTGLKMTNSRFHTLFGRDPRKPESSIESFHMDLACSIQAVLEEAMLKLVNQLHKEFNFDNLCLAGGVALNCVINGRILRETPVKNLWIQPAAGDAGGALGAAMEVWHSFLKNKRTVYSGKDTMNGSLLGPKYTNEQIESFLKKQDVVFEKLPEHALIETVSDQLSNGKVVGWFQGRMEFGPRALGNRSILGDPRNPTMQSTMNLKIKNRESFRPFAPAVLAKYVSQYFNFAKESPYMLLVADVAEEYLVQSAPDRKELQGLGKINQVRSCFPAITHVNNSARLQTVHEEINPRFYKLIHRFFDDTGCPMLINTSFNVRDEPIVCTPEDAYRCFISTEMDLLVLENFIIRK